MQSLGARHSLGLLGKPVEGENTFSHFCQIPKFFVAVVLELDAEVEYPLL